MSDRSASLRRCSTTASGRESFPRSAGSPGSAETHTTLGHIQSRSPGPPARHPAFSQAVDEVTGSKTRSDQQETNGRRSAHTVSETALDQPAQRRPWMGTAPLRLHVPTATRPGSLSFKCTGRRRPCSRCQTPSAAAARASPPSAARRSGAYTREVINRCWEHQDRVASRTSSEKVTSTQDGDEFAGRPWSVFT